MARTYKIRQFTNGTSKRGKSFTNYSLTVPATIASQLDKDLIYECVLTDAGILFKPVPPEPSQIPGWAQGEAAADPPPLSNGGRRRKRPARQPA